MTSKHKSEDYKITAVKYYLKLNKTQNEVCDIFKCSSRSLMRWVDKYNKNGNVERNSKKSKAYKVKKNM